MQTTPTSAELSAAVKKTLTSAAFGKFMAQAVQTAVAELQAQPCAVTLRRQPTARVRFTEGDEYRSFTARSADHSREISMQCQRPGVADAYKPGIWYGSETLTDADGAQWDRRLGEHVQDDFGMLVPVSQ